MRLLVYGSLRKGGALHNYWLSQEPISKVILENYEMYDVAGWFPAVCKGDDKIICELYDVEDVTFESIKQMEEQAGYTTNIVNLPSGEARIFLMDKDEIKYNMKVKNGDWLKYLK